MELMNEHHDIASDPEAEGRSSSLSFIWSEAVAVGLLAGDVSLWAEAKQGPISIRSEFTQIQSVVRLKFKQRSDSLPTHPPYFISAAFWVILSSRAQ
jgi:hypothetical protein